MRCKKPYKGIHRKEPDFGRVLVFIVFFIRPRFLSAYRIRLRGAMTDSALKSLWAPPFLGKGSFPLFLFAPAKRNSPLPQNLFNRKNALPRTERVRDFIMPRGHRTSLPLQARCASLTYSPLGRESFPQFPHFCRFLLRARAR